MTRADPVGARVGLEVTGSAGKALEAELVLRSKRLTDLETEGATARRRVSEVESIIAAQTDELRGMQQTCRTAEHAREVTEQEIRVLREHITQLNEGLAERDRLRNKLAVVRQLLLDSDHEVRCERTQ